MRRDPPSGTVTFLFSDIEGSTRLLERAGGSYTDLLETHRRLLRAAFAAHDGYEVDTSGDGFFVAFQTANDAAAAAITAQRALVEHDWPSGHAIHVRMGIHTGEPLLVDGDYVGLDVHQAARLMAVGHGGQVLVSQATRALLDPKFAALDLGEHRLKDLSLTQRIFQLQAEGLPKTFAALNSLDGRATNLPLQATPLIGRDRELQSLARVLRRDEVRLLTLTGAGGTGKTRLGLQLAATLVDEFPDGVFFVSLAPIADSTLVISTIAQTLGIRERGGESIFESLIDYVRGRELLLLLDNFEHVVAASPAVGELLRTSERLKVLVTSRMPLRLAAEHEFPVPPLQVPPAASDPAMLMQYAAVSLFVARAQAVNPDVHLSESSLQAIAQICTQLDGLPLAIELAAARSKLLPPELLLDRLDERLRLLTGGARDLPERHRTLRATIEWSLQLLDADERTLFRRLGVFAGGCTLAAAEAVCGGDLDVLAGIQSLVDKSLVKQPAAAGTPRLATLATIGDVAVEELAGSGEIESVARRHAEFYLDHLKALAADLRGRDQIQALDRFIEEHDNVRSALRWAISRGDVELALGFVASGWQLWDRGGFLSEGIAWIDAALEVGSAGHGPLLGDALNGQGCLFHSRADNENATRCFEEALQQYAASGYERRRAWTLNNQGLVAADIGALGQATELHVESLELARELNDELLIASAAINLGNVAYFECDWDRAASYQHEGREMALKLGDSYRVSLTSLNLGWIELDRPDGDLEGAGDAFRDALRRFREQGTPRHVPDALEGLAVLALRCGDPARTANLLGAAEALRERLEVRLTPHEVAMYERAASAGGALIGVDAFESARQEGRALEIEAAISLGEEGAARI